jgi:hypothetical protein
MTLFKILTRQLAAGKIRVTRKLLTQLRRETGGKRHSKPPKARGRKPHGPSRSCCGESVAARMLSICLVTGHPTTAALPAEINTATSLSSWMAGASLSRRAAIQ